MHSELRRTMNTPMVYGPKFSTVSELTVDTDGGCAPSVVSLDIEPGLFVADYPNSAPGEATVLLFKLNRRGRREGFTVFEARDFARKRGARLLGQK